MNKTDFIIFLLIVCIVYFLIHFFVYVRVVKGLGLPQVARNYLKIFFLISALSFFIDKFLGTRLLIYPIAVFGSVWLGIIAIAFTIFVFQNLLVLILPQFTKQITFAAIILVFLVSCFSIYNAALPPRVKKIEIPVKGLPSELTGFSIVQLSDLHLEGWKSKKWLMSIIETTNKLTPDVILITGDLIDRNVNGSIHLYGALRKLKSKYGIFAVTGNHEYYAGIEMFLELSKKTGICALRNERVTIANGIEIAGIEDETGEAISGTGPDLKTALEGCDPNMPVILLSHRPKYLQEAVSLGVDLQLSGHTHAGQIPPIDLIVSLIYKYPYGLYSYKTSFIYTTCGTGTWGPPMRLFSRSEIVNIILI